MSHQEKCFLTPWELLFGELVAGRPGRLRLFETLAIDCCWQGARTLRDAGEGKGLSTETVLEPLEADAATDSEQAFNLATLPPAELASHR